MSIVSIRPVVMSDAPGAEKLGGRVIIAPDVDRDMMEYKVDIPKERLEDLSNKLGYDLSDRVFNPNEEHPFWDKPDKLIRLDGKSLILDPSKPLDELKMYIAKAHHSVADSPDKIIPSVTVAVLTDRTKEIRAKAQKIQKRRKLDAAVYAMTLEEKVNAILYVDGVDYSTSSDSEIDLTIDGIIENKPAMLEKFIEDLKKRPKWTGVYVAVKKGLANNTLYTDGSNIYYRDIMIGSSETDAVEYLLSDKELSKKEAVLASLGIIRDRKSSKKK